MNNFLHFRVGLVIFLGMFMHGYHALGQSDLSAREQREIKQYFADKYRQNNVPVLKGVDGTIPSLGSSYCSDGGYVDLVPPSWDAQAATIEWTITTFVGVAEEHPTWGEYIGTGQATVFRFYLDRVEQAYFGQRIYFDYIQRNGVGLPVGTVNNDYTFVYQTPTAFDFGVDQEICAGESATLNLDGSEVGMEYFLLDGGGAQVGFPISGTGTPIAFNVSAADTYTVEARNIAENSCTQSMNGSATVTVNALPSATASNDGPECVGGNVQITGGPGGMTTYSWTGPNGYMSNAQSPLLTNVTLADAGDYILTITDANTCENTALTTVVVNENPTATVAYNAPVCEGGNLTLTATPSGGSGVYTSYAWTKDGNPIVGESNSTLVINPAALTDSGQYGVVVTDGSGCVSPEVFVDVTIQALPIPTINGSPNPGVTEMCSGNTLTLVGGGGAVGAIYQWTLPDLSTFVGSTLTIPNIPATTIVGEMYTLKVIEGTCEQTLDHVVVVNPTPVVTLISDQAGDEFCDGTLVTFTAGGADEYIFYKNGVNPANIVQARSASNTYADNTLVNGDVIIVEGFDTSFIPATECSATANVTVTVNQVVATISISSPGAVICAGTPVVFNANAVKTPNDPGAIFNYDFHRVRGASDVSMQSSASSTYSDNALQDGDQIYVIITEANSGCSDTSASVGITVNPNPVVTLTPDANPVCDGTNVTFTATAGFANYEFFVNSVSQQNGASNSYSNSGLADGDQIYVVATSAAGCSASSAPPVVMTINPLPSPTITGNFSPCVTETETYTTEVGFSSYIWTVTGGSVVGGGNGNDFVDVQWNSTGNQTLTVSYQTAVGCPPAAPTSQAITVNSLPTVTLIGDAAVCFNGTGAYSTETGMSNYVWNVVGGAIQTDDGNGSITVLWNTLGNGSVSVNYDNANGCGASSPTVLATTVHNLPTPTITGSADVCFNSIEQYSTEGGFNNYDWTVVGGTIIPTANPHIIDVQWTSTGVQSISVNYEATAGNCQAASPTLLNVQVNTLPAPTINGPNDICQNSSGNVYSTEAGMTGYVWTIVGGTIDSGNGTNTVSVTWNNSGAQTISVTYTDGNGCEPATPTDFAVNVNALPVPTITGAATVCNGTTEIYSTETGMSNYAWTVSAGGTITSGQNTESITVDWSVNGPQTLTVTYTDGNTCDPASPTSSTVTVVDLPTPTITGSATVCEGHSVSYSTEAGGSNYDWQIVGGTITPTAQPHIVDVVWSIGVGKQISVNYELASCPAATPFVLPVTVNPIPTVSLNGPAEACLNSAGHIYSTESGQNNYQWTVTGGTVTAGAGTDQITVTWDVLGAGSVEVNYDNLSSCSAVAPTRLDVTVHPLPIPTITGNSTVCNTYSEVYSTETGMSNYNWVVSGGTIDTDDNNGTIEVIWNTVGVQTISVTYTDPNSCDPASPTVLNVDVQDTPIPTITGSATACNDNTEIYTTESGHLNYIWTVPAEGTILSGTGTESITVLWNTVGIHTIEVNYEFANGCTAPATTQLDVTVNPLSGVGLVATPATSVIAGTEITFTASGTDVVNYDFKRNGVLDASHDGSDTYLWTPSDVSDNNTVVRVIATTSNGCKDSTELTISVFEGLIPSDVEPLTQTYCEGAPDAVSIYVLPPVLVGVTYELIRVDDNQTIGSIDVADASTEVRWTHGVNGVDFNYSGTATYKVESYWPSVPADRIEMNNQVTVTETTLPDNSFTMDPIGVVTGCNAGAGYEITLSGSEVDVVYNLTVDGVLAGTIPGDGNPLNFGFQLTTGVYQIIGDRNGCTSVMSGTFEIQSDWEGLPQDVVGNPTNGRYCTGDTGVEVILQGSEAGTNYVVNYNGSEIIGSDWTGDGSSHVFGPYTSSGDYTVNIKTPSGCYYSMNGLVTVTEVALPSVFNLLAESNITTYCPGDIGVKLLLDNKEAGVRYTLYQDGVFAEDTLVIIDGGQLLFDGDYTMGNYSVTANIEGLTCQTGMANTLDVMEDPLPVILDLQGETSYCEGGGSAQLFMNNPEADVTYELVLDGTPTGDFGSVAGAQIVWNVSTAGLYTVQAIKNNPNTNCGPIAMNGSVSVVMTALPENRVLTVVDGTDCANGTVVTIPNSQTGVRYVLIDNDTNIPVPGYEVIGNGSPISFSPIFDVNGSYRVEGYNGTCGIIMDNDSPNTPLILVNIPGVVGKQTIDYIPSGPICVGSGGIIIRVHTPEPDVDYVLYRIDGSGTDIFVETLSPPYSSDPIEFSEIYAEGDYKVVGYDDFVGDPTGCNNEMLNRVTIIYNPLPKSYRLTGADKYCSGDPAILTLDGSELNYEYTLLRNDGTGNVPVDTKLGTGSELEFIPITESGSYTVYSISPDGCTSSMRDTVGVSSGVDIDMQVAEDAIYEYCESDGSTNIILVDQQLDVLYQAIDRDGVVAAEVLGTSPGQPLELGPITVGKYAIWGSYNGLGCNTMMNNTDSVVVIGTPEPEKKTVIADAYSVCGADGATIILSASQVGIEYYIYDGTLERDTLLGDGTDLSWNVSEPVSGPYSYQIIAIANTTCNAVMGTIDITFKDGPTPFTMFAQDGTNQYADTIRYCADGDGIEIGVSATQSGIGYILLKDFIEEVGFFSGDGSNRLFSGYFKGAENDTVAYSVRAVNFSTGCAVEWSDTIHVIEDALPVPFNVELRKLSGDISDCSILCRGLANVDEIQLDGSVIGTTYSLLLNDAAIDPAVDSVGTSNMINFGSRDVGGYYKVQATTVNGCQSFMNGLVQLYQEPLVAIDDALSLRYGSSEGDTSVWHNDVHDISLDSISDPNKNIYFELVDTQKPNERGIVQLTTPIGNKVEIYPDGRLIFNKKPSFYGRDSVDYVVYNTSYAERRDTARVYFFVGNIPVDPENDLLIPNAFSPNGDNINDRFVIDGEFKNQVSESKLEVFNRWGTVVYRSKGNEYANDWDGKSNAGAMVSLGSNLPDGTYFYVFTIKINKGENKVETKEYNGYIELRR